MKRYSIQCWSDDGIEYTSGDGKWIKVDDFEKFLVLLTDYLYPSKHFGASECLEMIDHYVQHELKEIQGNNHACN